MEVIEPSLLSKSLRGRMLEDIVRTRTMFQHTKSVLPADALSHEMRVLCKMNEYKRVRDLENAPLRGSSSIASVPVRRPEAEAGSEVSRDKPTMLIEDVISDDTAHAMERLDDRETKRRKLNDSSRVASSAIIAYNEVVAPEERLESSKPMSRALALRRAKAKVETPGWHAPWKLMRVISGHLGWVRCVAVDPTNEWFATGSADRTVKIWDLASGALKLTLTGHIHTVRGIAISKDHPYMFTAGEDKQVKCWDLEYNKVIRHYHGHLSGVFAAALHPTLHVLMTAGRDSVCRVWDIRSKNQVFVLGGHQNAVTSILTQGVDPQVITSSFDTTIKLWDLAAGKAMATLTHHKKAVRSLAMHPTEFTFASGGGDNTKKWLMPEGRFLANLEGQNTPVNTMAVNNADVLFTGGDNGSMHFWDWKTGHCFQKTATTVQSGSLEAEAGIYASAFDQSGSRLITCEADKTIKIWREDDEATEETHPIDMEAWTKYIRQPKRY